MSRKLIFAAGLLHCFFCQLDGSADKARAALAKPNPDVAELTKYMEHQLALTPLDCLAKACLELDIESSTAKDIFDNYDRFLAILDDPNKRDTLKSGGPPDEFRKSEIWSEVRAISRPFHDALVSLFLNEDESLSELTRQYGVF